MNVIRLPSRHLARTTDAVEWDFFGDFVKRVDAFNKERESQFSESGFRLQSK